MIFFSAMYVLNFFKKVFQATWTPNLLRHLCFTSEKYHYIQNFIFIGTQVVVILVLYTILCFSGIICKLGYVACKRMFTVVLNVQ